MPRRNSSTSAPNAPQRRIQPARNAAAACRAKQRFGSADEADEALYDALIMRPGTPLTTYQCLECFGWHLTSSPSSATINVNE